MKYNYSHPPLALLFTHLLSQNSNPFAPYFYISEICRENLEYLESDDLSGNQLLSDEDDFWDELDENEGE